MRVDEHPCSSMVCTLDETSACVRPESHSAIGDVMRGAQRRETLHAPSVRRPEGATKKSAKASEMAAQKIDLSD
jgi:hypothetical protein